jgi:cytoskeletal protein CcmA (bactofilin family)
MFQRSTPAAGARPRAPKSGAPGLSFIGPEVLISGNVATDAQLHVDGRIDGDVRCGNLSQGTGSIIAGNIQADEARLAGTVEGTVVAGILSVEASARILGDVAYETISIEAGAQIEGRLARRASLGLDEGATQLIATPVPLAPATGGEIDARNLFAVADSPRSSAG